MAWVRCPSESLHGHLARKNSEGEKMEAEPCGLFFHVKLLRFQLPLE